MFRYFSLAKLRAQLAHVNTGLLPPLVAVILVDLKAAAGAAVLLVSGGGGGRQNVQSQVSLACCRCVTSASHSSR